MDPNEQVRQEVEKVHQAMQAKKQMEAQERMQLQGQYISVREHQQLLQQSMKDTVLGAVLVAAVLAALIWWRRRRQQGGWN